MGRLNEVDELCKQMCRIYFVDASEVDASKYVVGFCGLRCSVYQRVFVMRGSRSSLGDEISPGRVQVAVENAQGCGQEMDVAK
jgi:hypothetical protein